MREHRGCHLFYCHLVPVGIQVSPCSLHQQLRRVPSCSSGLIHYIVHLAFSAHCRAWTPGFVMGIQ